MSLFPEQLCILVIYRFLHEADESDVEHGYTCTIVCHGVEGSYMNAQEHSQFGTEF